MAQAFGTRAPVETRVARPCMRAQPRPRVSVARAAAAEASSASSSATGNKWYACVANAQFMLNDVQNESFAEQLREKTRYYKEQNKPIDFFLVCEPEWLEQQHPDLAKKVGRPCVALVAQEESWAKYMKLRLDRVLYMEVEGTEDEITKCGAPVPEFPRLDSGDKKWVAPYSPYAPGWWNVFMPGAKDA